ncbi:Zn-binding domain-containing protein [Undibacterium arcticum]
MHTFAHALIRQLTLECGYSSASLRERLYVSEGEQGMAGLLIYTATPDSDGTLGGLQRQAMPDLLGPAVEGAIRSAQWCSSDPLCINGEMTAPESHSLASCHSCTMVPETSCEMHNRFLDRALLVGKDDNPTLGYFRALLETE